MKIYNILDLPQDIVRLIYMFCIDKRENWDKVGEQFLKGGFNRKNLRIIPFIQRQKKMCAETWLGSRPELDGYSEWNPATRMRELCPFSYDNDGWSIKRKCAIVYFRTRGEGFNKIYSSRNPVSKWLQNIDKFETAAVNWRRYKLFIPSNKTPLDYLPKEKNKFGIKFESLFYKKRAVMLQKKREKKAHLKKQMCLSQRDENSKKCADLKTTNR